MLIHTQRKEGIVLISLLTGDTMTLWSLQHTEGEEINMAEQFNWNVCTLKVKVESYLDLGRTRPSTDFVHTFFVKVKLGDIKGWLYLT